ncbi:MAG TPA: N-acetylmuramoyl-L-alanine amidase [Chthoniobacterales bacterium]|nr:N-acetylmuramoyl-L-alanine amidase [Chthoniobacterales bacterium]
MSAHSAFAHPDRFGPRAARLAVIVVVCMGVAGLLHAQLTEEQKKQRDAFLKAREEMRTIASPTPSASPGSKPKPATKKSKKGATPKPQAAPEDGDDADEDAAASPAKKKPRTSPSPTANAAPGKRAGDDEGDESRPRVTAPPRVTSPVEEPTQRAVPAPTVIATPMPQSTAPVAQLPADITIEKSGLEEEQGMEPPPPPPRRRGFFARLFGGRSESYRYLNRGVIEAIRRAPVQRNRWKFIIVHNSGTRQGNARAFDHYHRRVRRMGNGMAYHFVVGNGTSSGNGEIEIGDRWRRQINGGHVHSDYLNNIGLGICLVGDFNRDRPTKAQMEATEELVKYLRQRCGKADVRPRREMNPPRWATDCPGDAFPYGWFRRF